MATVTITERQHWKERIEFKLDQRIHQLRSSSTNLLETIALQAKEIVASRLNVQEDFDHHSKLEDDLKLLASERDQLLDTIAIKVYGDELPYSVSMRNIESEIQNLEDAEASAILMLHPVGQQIARLREEREELGDLALLATSVSNISALLDRVDSLNAEQAQEPEHVQEPPLLVTEYSYQQ